MYLVLERSALSPALGGNGVSCSRDMRSPSSTGHCSAQQMPFKAHAWVEVEDRVVNDKPYTPEMYAVLDRC